MKLNKITLALTSVLLFSIIISGCGSEQNVKYKSPEYKEMSTGSFELIGEELYGVGYVEEIVEYKSYLIVFGLNFDNKTYLHIYDKATGKLILDNLYEGRGPRELLYATFINFDSKTGIYHVHDHGRSSYMTFQIDSLIANPISAIKESAYNYELSSVYVSENEEKSVIVYNPSPRRMDTTSINRIVVRDKSNGRSFSYNDYPVYDNDMKRWFAHANNCNFAIDPDYNKLAVATYYGNILETFDISGPIKRLSGKYYEEFHATFLISEKRQETRIDYEKTKMGFCDLFATGSFIYGVYDGRARTKEYKNLPDEEKPLRYNNIVVYDWKGRALKYIETDHEIEAIYVNEKDNIVYAVVRTGEGAFIAKLKI